MPALAPASPIIDNDDLLSAGPGLAAPASGPAVSDDALVDDLVRRSRAGDAEAFSELYGLFADRVYRYCLSRVRGPADAEDLTQLTFLRVVEALPRFEARGLPFAAWLFAIARNAVIDFVRARREHATLDGIDVVDPRLHAPDSGDAGDGLAIALPYLTTEQREVLAYRFVAGLSAQETADAMGRHPAAIRALQFRAIGALRRRMSRSALGRRRTSPGTAES
jgi:RNA polymerase sigma-70 factor (ECF subfamily)